MNQKQTTDEAPVDDDSNESLENESTTCNPDQSDKEVHSVSENSDDISQNNFSTNPTCSHRIKQEKNERSSHWAKRPRYEHSSDSFSNTSSSGSSTSPRQLFTRAKNSSDTNFNNSLHSPIHHQNNSDTNYQSYRNFNGHFNNYNHHNHNHNSFNNYRHKNQTNNSTNFNNRFNHSNQGSINNIHSSNEISLINNHQTSSSALLQNTSLTSNSLTTRESSNNFTDVSVHDLNL